MFWSLNIRYYRLLSGWKLLRMNRSSEINISLVVCGPHIEPTSSVSHFLVVKQRVQRYTLT